MSRAIFFDLDGTLTDSGPGIINCAQLALAHFGIQVPDRDQLRVFVGPPLRQSFARFGVPPASLDEAIARFRARYVPIGKFENTPYPGIAGPAGSAARCGIPSFRGHLQAPGHRPGGAGAFPAGPLLRARLRGLPGRRPGDQGGRHLLSSRPDRRPRPGGDGGDTAFDVLGAKVHGIPTIGVTWGYGQAEAMREAGAAALADTPEQLEALLHTPGVFSSAPPQALP